MWQSVKPGRTQRPPRSIVSGLAIQFPLVLVVLPALLLLLGAASRAGSADQRADA